MRNADHSPGVKASCSRSRSVWVSRVHRWWCQMLRRRLPTARPACMPSCPVVITEAGVQSSRPVWADLRPSAWTSRSLLTPKELPGLSAWMSDHLGESVPLESVVAGRLHITIPNLQSPITHSMLTFGKVSVISKHIVSLLCVQMWVWSNSPLGWRRIWGSEIWFSLTKKKN